MVGDSAEPDVYALIGEEGFERLIAAFYRQVPGDDILGPMYPANDLAGAQQRLRDFRKFVADQNAEARRQLQAWQTSHSAQG